MIHIRKQTLWWRLWQFNYRWSICSPNPYDTNLCQFMRCVLLWLPLKFLSAALVLSAMIAWWDEVWFGLTFAAGIIGLFVSVLAGIVYVDKHNMYPNINVADTLVWQYVKAKKQKLCPLVVVE